jgi:hypothetical protein
MMRTSLGGSLSARAFRRAALLAAVGLGVVAVTGWTPRLEAQVQISIPNINGPKQAALHAVGATNAHTAAEQDAEPATPSRGAPVSLPSTRASAAPMKPGAAAPAVHQPVMSVASHPASAVVAGSKTGAVAGKPAGAVVPVAVNSSTPAVAAAKAVPPGGPGSVGDSAGNSISVTQRGVKGEVSLNREVFSYDPGARRDPFISLMRSGDLRPMLSDLRLVTVLYDATGRNSIAVMRDQSTKDQYRVRVGQTLGRMRVVQIQPKQVVFTIEEVGFSRQEALALGDTTKTRAP